MCMISFNHLNDHMRKVLFLSVFCRWENWRKLNNFSKVTWLLRSNIDFEPRQFDSKICILIMCSTVLHWAVPTTFWARYTDQNRGYQLRRSPITQTSAPGRHLVWETHYPPYTGSLPYRLRSLFFYRNKLTLIGFVVTVMYGTQEY